MRWTGRPAPRGLDSSSPLLPQIGLARVAPYTGPHHVLHEDPGPAVDRRGAEGGQRRLVPGARVALVAVEVVGGKMLGLALHQPIAGDLGQDRSRGDREAPGV